MYVLSIEYLVHTSTSHMNPLSVPSKSGGLCFKYELCPSIRYDGPVKCFVLRSGMDTVRVLNIKFEDYMSEHHLQLHLKLGEITS